MKSDVSVVINTRNEAENIQRAIKSVKSLADEVIVVDMDSTDETQQLAKKEGAKVFRHPYIRFVEPARNFAIAKATCSWVLILDADEKVPSTLSKKLLEVVKENEYDFVRIPRRNIIFGKWMTHARWWPDHNIRFFRKGNVIWDKEIHSVPITSGEGLTLEAQEELALTHYNYQTVEQFIDRLNRYSTIQAEYLFEKGKRANATSLMRVPFTEFLSRYFAGEGYKDGMHGLSLSLLQSFSEVVVQMKLWQMNEFKPKKVNFDDVKISFKENQKDLAYWLHDAILKENPRRLVSVVKRKLKLL